MQQLFGVKQILVAKLGRELGSSVHATHECRAFAPPALHSCGSPMLSSCTDMHHPGGYYDCSYRIGLVASASPHSAVTVLMQFCTLNCPCAALICVADQTVMAQNNADSGGAVDLGNGASATFVQVSLGACRAPEPHGYQKAGFVNCWVLCFVPQVALFSNIMGCGQAARLVLRQQQCHRQSAIAGEGERGE